MAKQKIEIEVDIPDGYEFVRYGVPIAGEFVIYPDDAVMRSSGVSFGSYIIVREALTQSLRVWPGVEQKGTTK